MEHFKNLLYGTGALLVILMAIFLISGFFAVTSLYLNWGYVFVVCMITTLAYIIGLEARGRF